MTGQDLHNPWAPPPVAGLAGRWPRRLALIAGLLLVVAAMDRTGETIRLLHRTEAAEAEVIGLRDEFVPGHRVRDQRWMQRPVVRFTTARGAGVEAPLAELVAPGEGWQPGHRLVVRYDPEEPAEAPRSGGFRALWWPVLAVWLQAAGFLALAWHWRRLVQALRRRGGAGG